MTMFTTSAMTGLRMNRSVKALDFMAGPSGWCRSGVGRLGRGIGAGQRGVVHLHGGGIPQLEDAGRDDLLARFDPFLDGHEVAAGGAELHDLLTDAEVF